MSAKTNQTKVESTSREIIEGRLLTSLEKGDCAALLVGDADLTILIDALGGNEPADAATLNRRAEFRSDLIVLRKGVFGK